MLNAKPRKADLRLFLDPTYKSNKLGTYMYQRDGFDLLVTNGHWMIKLPWHAVPMDLQGYFPEQHDSSSCFIDGKAQEYSKASINLVSFLADHVSRCETELVPTSFVWSDPHSDQYSARLFRPAGEFRAWAGINEQYLSGIENIFVAPQIVGSSPTDACLIVVDEEPVGVIMPVRAPDPSETFVVEAAVKS